MTTSKVLPIDAYQFTESDVFLFDANIWIYLYVPQEANRWEAVAYSKALAEISKVKGAIFIDVLVLSEFINRYARLEHGRVQNQGALRRFKRYRESSAFMPVAKAIADASRRILKHCHRTESCFESVDINTLLADYETMPPDFNDQMLTEICRTKGLKLVTHDSDFKNAGLTVLTANKKLLA